MRVFIAIFVKSPLVEVIEEVLNNLKPLNLEAKWQDLKNMHFTLKFLGEVNENFLPRIYQTTEEALSQVKSFDISLSTLGVFPNINFPKVLWIGVDKGKDELTFIANNIEKACSKLGFKKDKPFTAHLTLCRLKSPKNKEKLIDSINKIKPKKDVMKAKEVAITKSQLTPKGPIYTVLKSIKLAP
jgi:2'-5' RNA ligase